VSGLGYDEGVTWADLSTEQRNAIADHTLIGEGSADTFDEANAFPVVNPGSGKLNENALDAANSRAPQADISESTAESIQSMARTLLEEEFNRDLGEEAGADPDLTEKQDTVSDDIASKLTEAVHTLQGAVGKLAETLGAGTPADDGDAPDETTDPTDDHAKDGLEAAKDAEPVEAGRDEHFPDGDELALTLESLKLMQLRTTL
jgi:hypothetical protein